MLHKDPGQSESLELEELRSRVADLETRLATADAGDRRYRLLLEHLNVGVFVSTLEGKLLECNQRAVEMSGDPSRDALIGADLERRYENAEDRARMIQELRARGAVRGFEFWTRLPDGRRTCSSMTAVLAPLGPDGSPLILGMLEDITDRKLAEERAGEGEERFRVLAEQSMLGIAILQDDGIRFVNQAVSDINGYSIEEMSSWNIADFTKVIHPDDVGFASEQARRKQAGDGSVQTHYDYRIFTKMGELRWIEQYSRTIEYGGRPANFVTLIDVTARRQVEQSLAQLAVSMERRAKLESLGVLAAGIAHDFNNLLSGLFGHLELAREHSPAGSPARTHLELGQQAFERAKGLTGQLLAFSKGGVPVRKIGSLARAVRECAEFALSGSNLKLELELDPELWPAEFDPSQLAQVFDNLLINAKQAMPSGGTLRIVARNVAPADTPPLVVKPGPHVKLSFIDQGPGIAPAILERIFDPFFTTKPEGSGLGLTTAYAISKKHDGYIEAESAEGRGATFHVWLPAAPGKQEPPQPPSVEPPSPHGSILLMDDDDIVRRVAGQMLTRLGYEPILTADGAAALAEARTLVAQGKAPVAALLDLTVRVGEGGRDIVGRLRDLLPHAPIIASSGYSDDPVMAEPTQFGFSASLNKPFLLSDLRALLARVISGS